jgi:hypothetical protein
MKPLVQSIKKNFGKRSRDGQADEKGSIGEIPIGTSNISES